MDISNDRRPLKTRSAAWARALAAMLAKANIAPDLISFCGIGFAILAAFAFYGIGEPEGIEPGAKTHAAVTLVIIAICVQARLLCNMLDGMVATEWKKKSAYGAIWNEVPDRIEDILFLVAAGHAAGMLWLGFLCATAAVFTAYIRAFGASLTGVQDFRGPMAKPHRMFALTCGCLIAAASIPCGYAIEMLQITLIVIFVGTVATCVRRLDGLAARLKERHDSAE